MAVFGLRFRALALWVRVLNLWTEHTMGILWDLSCLVIAGLVVRASFNKSSSFSRATSVCSPLSRTASDRGGSARAGLRQTTSAKTVWVWTKSKDVMTASVEGGWSTFIFTPETKDLADEWTCWCSSPFALPSQLSCSA
jgi:hypothetical protein